MNLKGLIFFRVLVIGLFFTPASGVAQQNAAILTGAPQGTFQRFIEHVNQASESSLISIESEGSQSNIHRLINGDSDFAISQNDVAYKQYREHLGGNELRMMLPLFYEYIQIIVPVDSDIYVLRDLERKFIGVGAEGSGTLQNATDLLEALNLYQIDDYTPFFVNYADGTALLRTGEIDALFVTGTYLVDTEEFRQLYPSNRLMQLLVEAYPYYEITPSSARDHQDTLSVRTSLFTHKRVQKRDVEALLSTLLANWKNIEKDWDDAANMDIAMLRTPVPFHRSTEKLLIDHEYAKPRMDFIQVFLWSFSVILAASLARRYAPTYDRLGSIHAYSRIEQGIDYISKIYLPIVILAICAVLLSGFLVAIQYSEEQYAAVRNIDNRFANIGFREGLIWVFMFMASGYVDVVFPSSPVAKFLISILALLGIAFPLWLVVRCSALLVTHRNNRQNGVASLLKLRNHVVICGWNSKVPGLVYTLTGQDAPHRYKVVIIAELEGSHPLSPWQFNPRFVSYIRGESSNPDVLTKAHAQHACRGIVVAGDAKVGNANLSSVVTAMLLKKLNPEMLVATEMAYLDNRHYFDAINLDKVVNTELLAERILASAAINECIVDFVLDSITHDGWYVAFSNTQPELEKNLGESIHSSSIAEVDQRLRCRGAKLIAIVHPKTLDARSVDADFIRHAQIAPLSELQDWSKPIPLRSDYIYASRTKKLANPSANKIPAPRQQELFDCHPRPVRHYLVAGSHHRNQAVVDELSRDINAEHIFPISFDDLTDREADQAIEAKLEELLNESVPITVIVMLGAYNRRENASNRSVIDMRSILRTRRIKSTLRRGDLCISEVSDSQQLQTMKDAGADIVVPSDLICERFLSKFVYGRGKVSDTLISLLSNQSAAHFASYRVKATDPVCGMDIADAFSAVGQSHRLVAWLPAKNNQALKNSVADFSFHFVFSDTKQTETTQIAEGDLLVVIESSDHSSTESAASK